MKSKLLNSTIFVKYSFNGEDHLYKRRKSSQVMDSQFCRRFTKKHGSSFLTSSSSVGINRSIMGVELGTKLFISQYIGFQRSGTHLGTGRRRKNPKYLNLK